jgi:hypothetical protein
MKLASMKLSSAAGPMESADYPYGLQLRLDRAQLEKLKLDQPQVGDEVMIEAKGIVTMYREAVRAGEGKSDCTVKVQITDLYVGASEDQRRERASASRLAEISKPTESRY